MIITNKFLNKRVCLILMAVSPTSLAETLAQVAKSDDVLLHQYTKDYGHPRLLNIVAKLGSKILLRQIDPNTEVLITPGRQAAIFITIMSLIDTGDEVVTVESCEKVKSVVHRARGLTKFVSFEKLDSEGIFNGNTKALVLSRSSRIYSFEELESVARLCRKWNIVCISDLPIAKLPEMWERTLTTTCLGEILGVPCWSVGWVMGPKNLIDNLKIINQHSISSGVTPIQEALARALENADLDNLL